VLREAKDVTNTAKEEVAALSRQLRTLIRLSDNLRSNLAAELRIGVTELTALGHVVEAEELSPTQLATRMAMAPATITTVVDHLVASGFASRTRHATDRRRLSVRPTPAGKHARAWAEERMGDLVVTALDRAPHPPPASMAAFLGRINEALAEAPSMPGRP
jgi:DNA-binding MarR family transcriptional regulator